MMIKWLARLFSSKVPPTQQLQGTETREVNRAPYVIGRINDLVRLQHMIAPDDPRRSLFVYHELRQKEAVGWSQINFQRLLDADEAGRFARLTTHIQQLTNAYPPEMGQDFLDVEPNATDSMIRDLCNQYREGNQLARSFIRSQIDFARAWTLLTFSKRAAIQGSRSADPELIRDALIAHAIENLAAEDVRDNMVALSLIYHCSYAVDPESNIFFEEVAGIAGPAISLLLKTLICRPDPDEILSLMDWHKIETPRGVGYIWGKSRIQEHPT